MRRTALWVFIIFLSLTALIAIVSVFGEEFGDLQIRILGTSLTISISSVCAMSGAAFIERNKMKEVGLAGIGCSVLAALLLMVMIWGDPNSDVFLKTTSSFVILALGFAHGFLLALPDLDEKHRWVQHLTFVTIALLAGFLLVLLWGEIDNNFVFKTLAAVSIIAGLETLVIPMLMKMKRKDPEMPIEGDDFYYHEELHLQHIEGERYRDHESGKEYIVSEMDNTH